jgi:phosphatidylserine/phosphatidylglycerophosphate/cardiolipin synthase-like enzyme
LSYINLKDNSPIIAAIESASLRKIDINIIYSKGFSRKSGQEALKRYKRVRLCYIADLHMKVYLSEKYAIVCSLNLHDFSINNNFECGIFINREEDSELWQQVYSMYKTDISKNIIIEKKREEYTWSKKKSDINMNTIIMNK